MDLLALVFDGTIVRTAVFVLIGIFVGWNIPQPKWAKFFNRGGQQ